MIRSRTVALMLGICVLSVVLPLIQSGNLNPRAIGGAHADDALFIRLATSLTEGHWLGDYDQMTLVKGAFFPAFIAFSHWLGTPLLVAQQLVALLASAVMSLVLYRLGLGRWWAIALFFMLAFNPVPWHPDPLRVTREPLYASLGLIVIALAALVLFERTGSFRRRSLMALFLGLSFSAYWLTREESIWLYPSLLLLGAVAIFLSDRTTESMKGGLASLVFATGGFVLVAGGVASLNVAYYGSFLTNEVREGDMARAYGALMRIQQDVPVPRVFFSTDAAQRAYEASPAARELEPSFSGENGQSWRRIGCEALSLDPCPPGFGGGWFMWALRDAVKAAGHMADAAAAQRFYAKLAREINDACDRKAIACSAERSSMTPAMSWTDIMDVPSRAFHAAALLLNFGGGNVGSPESEGQPEQLAAFEKMVGVISRPTGPKAGWVLEGWVAAPTCVPQPSVVDGNGANVARSVSIREAPDVVSYFEARGKNALARRFTVTTACQSADCRLLLSGCGDSGKGVALAELQKGLHPTADSAVLFLDNIEKVQGQGAELASSEWDLLIAKTAAAWYSTVMMPGFILGFCMFAFSLYRFREANPVLAAVAAAALGAFAARSVLIAVIDVTSWDAINLQYMMPTAPFVLVFTVVGSWLGWSAFWGRTPSVGKAQN